MRLGLKGGALPLFITVCCYIHSAAGIRSMSADIVRPAPRELCGGWEYCGKDKQCRSCAGNRRCVRDSAAQWLCTHQPSWLSMDALLSSVFQPPSHHQSRRLLEEQSGCTLGKQAIVSTRQDLVDIGEVCGGRCFEDESNCNNFQYINKQAACCPDDKFCWPASEYHWFCKTPKRVETDEGKCAPAGARCGGKIECFEYNMITGLFDTFNKSCKCCESGYECKYIGSDYDWTCQLPSYIYEPGNETPRPEDKLEISPAVSPVLSDLSPEISPEMSPEISQSPPFDSPPLADPVGGFSVPEGSPDVSPSPADTLAGFNVPEESPAVSPSPVPETNMSKCALGAIAELERGLEEQGEVCGGKCFMDGSCSKTEFINKPAACCPGDKYCWPASEWHWFCKSPAPLPQGQCAPAGGRCGGKLECFKPDANSPTGFQLFNESCGCCASGLECTPKDEFEWFCLPPGGVLDAANSTTLNSTTTDGGTTNSTDAPASGTGLSDGSEGCALSEKAELEVGLEDQGEVCGGRCFKDSSCSKWDYVNKQVACCPEDKYCWPASEWHWFCKGTKPQLQGQCAPAGGRCGGKLECFKEDLDSATGYKLSDEACGCCSSGFECTRQNEWEWFCLPPGGTLDGMNSTADASVNGTVDSSMNSTGNATLASLLNLATNSSSPGNIWSWLANSTNVSPVESPPVEESATSASPGLSGFSVPDTMAVNDTVASPSPAVSAFSVPEALGVNDTTSSPAMLSTLPGEAWVSPSPSAEDSQSGFSVLDTTASPAAPLGDAWASPSPSPADSQAGLNLPSEGVSGLSFVADGSIGHSPPSGVMPFDGVTVAATGSAIDPVDDQKELKEHREIQDKVRELENINLGLFDDVGEDAQGASGEGEEDRNGTKPENGKGKEGSGDAKSAGSDASSGKGGAKMASVEGEGGKGELKMEDGEKKGKGGEKGKGGSKKGGGDDKGSSEKGGSDDSKGEGESGKSGRDDREGDSVASEGGSDGSEGDSVDSEGGSDGTEGDAEDSAVNSDGSEEDSVDSAGNSDGSEEDSVDSAGNSDGSEEDSVDSAGNSDGSEEDTVDSAGNSDGSEEDSVDSAGNSDGTEGDSVDSAGHRDGTEGDSVDLP